jgi:hypothetical protein
VTPPTTATASTASIATGGLYPRLLGAAWQALDPAVRAAHAGDTAVRAEGVFRVCRAPGRFARLLLDAARVPPASAAAEMRLVVCRRGPLERWQRSFGGRPLMTIQTEAPAGRLAERLGVLEFRFRLAVEDGALLYVQEAVLIRLGPLRLALPGWLAPRVAGRERPVESTEDDRTHSWTSVAVEVTTPRGGPLFSYRGWVRWRVAPSDPEMGVDR